MPMAAALARHHPRDSWFQGITVREPKRGAWPRILKPVLEEPEVAERLVLAFAVSDLDRPQHRSNPWRSVEEAELAVMETAARLDGSAAVYATRGGLRAVWAIEDPVPVRLAQSWMNQFHEQFLARIDGLVVPVDRGVKDWGRGYRLPWCPRCDGKGVPWGDGAPPMDLAALTWGRVLEWAPSTPLKEEQVRAPVTGPWDTSGVGSPDSAEDEIQACVVRWAGEISAAASRHDVLLKKATALGGLCAHFKLAPDPWVAVLIEAAGDSGDPVHTAECGLAYGRARPWAPKGRRTGGYAEFPGTRQRAVRALGLRVVDGVAVDARCPGCDQRTARFPVCDFGGPVICPCGWSGELAALRRRAA